MSLSLVLLQETEAGEPQLALVTLKVLVSVISPDVSEERCSVLGTEAALLLTAQQPICLLLVTDQMDLQFAARVELAIALGTVEGRGMRRLSMCDHCAPVGKVQVAGGTRLLTAARVLLRMVRAEILQVQEACATVLAFLRVVFSVRVKVNPQRTFLRECLLTVRTVDCFGRLVDLFEVSLHVVFALVHVRAVGALDGRVLNESMHCLNVPSEVLGEDKALVARCFRAFVSFLQVRDGGD